MSIFIYGKDFREAKEMEYYQTIGSDLWLHRLRVYIAGVRDAVGAALGKEGRIISPGDITMEMLFGKKYNKFRKRGPTSSCTRPDACGLFFCEGACGRVMTGVMWLGNPVLRSSDKESSLSD